MSKKEVEPSWKARRAKAKAKAKMGRSEAGQGTNGNTMDKLEDPDPEHWGELLGDAKGEGGVASVSPGAGGSGEESPAQKKVKKKKKKKGNQWNKKALNLWVYVRGDHSVTERNRCLSVDHSVTERNMCLSVDHSVTV